MIIEPPTHFTQPELIGARWVIKEVDSDTGEAVADFGYPTEYAAWEAFNMLSRGWTAYVAPDTDTVPYSAPADTGGADETA